MLMMPVPYMFWASGGCHWQLLHVHSISKSTFTLPDANTHTHTHRAYQHNSIVIFLKHDKQYGSLWVFYVYAVHYAETR